MCGIFGSDNFETFKQLFQENQARGTFASGTLYVGDECTYVRKNDSTYLIDEQSTWDDVSSFDLYLGHVQAPTSSCREWQAQTTHPFEFDDWIVAHNGVLENHNELINSMFQDHTNPVDSSVIPRLLHELYLGDIIYCITEAMNKLKGTFACWIHNRSSGRSFVVRSGSTLYCDRLSNSFSSVPIDGVCVETVEQGVIYELTKEGQTRVGEFNYDNPFLIL